MELLQALGVNFTYFIQFLIIAVVLLILTYGVYSEFHKNLLERIQRTQGSQELALQTQKKAQLLLEQYQMLLSEQNEKIRGIFNQADEEFTRENQALYQEASAKIESLKNENHQQLVALRNSFDSSKTRWVEDLSDLVYQRLVR